MIMVVLITMLMLVLMNMVIMTVFWVEVVII